MQPQREAIKQMLDAQKVAKRARQAAPRVAAAAEDARTGPEPDCSLFAAVAAGKSAVQTLVDEWLGSYKKDQESGFVELINFLVRSCGCRGVVTTGMLRTLQNSEIIQQLTESFDEESAEYPLSLSTPAWRRFRVGFCELMAVLVHRAQYGVIYDGFLMDSLIALLTGMSDSQVRAFRHTSTLAAMKLMTGLVHVALSVSMQKENRQRQYEAEQAKALSRRALEKLEGLLEQRKEFQEKQQELESLMNAIFKGVFVHRYRDLVPEIRAICIEEMGQWIQHYSQSFLTDGYLKYIGWTLYDKQGEVRLKCLLALQGLYGSQVTASRMELFTSRFKERMVSMVLDKEPQVGVEAVRLLILILQNMGDVLTDSDCENVFPLVFASGRPLATAAGEFLYKKLLAPPACARREAEERPRSSPVSLQLLLRFFIESEFHDHMAYLVDSLWDCASVLLKDWPVMTGLLLDEPPGEGLGDRQESALVLLLVASMRQATEGHPPVGRVSGKKYLELLLTQLWEVVDKHTDSEVLEVASRALHVLCCPELPFYSRADFARSRLVDHLADKFQYKATELLQSSFLEREEAYSLATTLKRIAIFHSAHNLTPWRFLEPCVQLLHHRVETGEVPAEVVVSALTCSHLSLLWELSLVHADAGPHSSESCLVDMEPCVQDQAFVLLSDLLLIFGPQLTQGGRQELQVLVYRPEPSLQSQLAGFLLDRVFNHGQAQEGEDEMVQIEQLHQRRSLLAGFCKLIVYGVLDLSAASDVFKYYSKFYRDYGDIIKETLNRARQIDRKEWARTLLLSLQQLWTQLLLEQGPRGVDSTDFLEMRDLARRFSLLFGLHQLQNRLALVALHKAGIKFAFQDPASPNSALGLVNLPFLELLSEFSPRLMEPDKALLLAYLKKTHQAYLSSENRKSPGWVSFLVYQHSLSFPEESALQPASVLEVKQRPRSATKRRRLTESSEARSEEPSRPSSAISLLQPPLLSSTVLREKQPPPLALPLGEEESGSESELVQSQLSLGSQWSHRAFHGSHRPQNHDDEATRSSASSSPLQPPQRGRPLPAALRLGREESGSNSEFVPRPPFSPAGEAAMEAPETSEEEEEEEEGLSSGPGNQVEKKGASGEAFLGDWPEFGMGGQTG
ncbi:hypothetical protein JRQ81_014504 [Phrynocephalus forsythii]|uniref:Cohesin subunit SA n=1 Tax=Phrynocephalus forsythii TaxID=171643 RepID=A0A9Q1B3J7_9SAUR|nr:hypothetical protein JRQ81_014504 [Phrynocephalus forsythii]